MFIATGQGGYCVTLVYPIPLLPSGPGGVFRLQLHSPPKPVCQAAGRLSGESGIRTHGGVTPTHAFQACSLNHSDISPKNFSTLTHKCSTPISRLRSFDLYSLQRHSIKNSTEINYQPPIINV